MAKSSLQSGSRTVYDAWSGSSKGSFSLEWYDLNDYLSIGICWGISSSNTSVSIAPKICRWDSTGTDNYSGTFDEALSPDPVGAGSWSGLSWSSNAASGWSGWYDTFNTRTYNRTHSNQTVKLTLYSYNLYSYGCGNYGSDTSTFTLTVSPLASYSVTYNANGGSGAPSAQTKWYGETLTLSSTKPTRTGYVFSKWNTKSDGSGTNYSSGANYTGNAALTLYAIWTEAKVTVNYHINGGTLTAQTTAGATATVYRASNNLVQLYNPTATTPAWTTIGTGIGSTATYANLYNVGTFPIVKTGHHIVASSAWNLNSGGTGNSFHQDDTATNTVNKVTTTRLNGGTQISSNVTKTLYVKWVPDTYTISYNANGGTGAPASQTKTYGVSLTLSSTKPTRTNYAFKNWNTNSAGTATAYAAGASFGLNAATTLYAQWTPYKVTVKYHVNGGTIVTNTASTTYQYRVNNNLAQYRNSTDSGTTWSDWTDGQTNVTVEDTYKNIWDVGGVPITKTGYHTVASMAWNTNTSGTGNSFHQADTADNTINKVTTTRLKGATLTADATVTLYANWKPDEYTVSYVANGGTSTPANQTKYYGTALTLASAITKNSDTTTYTVTYNYNGGSGTVTSNSAVKTTPYSFSCWKATNGTTYAASGSYTANAATTMTAQWTTGTSSTTTVALPTGTRTDHTIQGWYTVSAATGGTKRGDAGGSYTPTQSETLYARWGYNVTYNKNSGTTTPTAQVKTHGTALTLQPAITRNNATTTYTVTFNYNGNGTADTTSSAVKTTQYSFASWKATSGTTYAASGSYTTDEPTVMTAQWSSSASTTTVALPSPTWTNYTLDGWYTVSAATGGTKRGNGGGSYTPTQSETLYARWILNTFTITYNGNGGTATPAVHTGIIGQNLRIADSPIRDGYIFSQWNTAADGTGSAYGRGSFYTGPDDLTLYAIWTKIKTVEDLEAVTIDDINKSIPISLVPSIWNKITQRFYGKILYEFIGTIDWNTIRTTPGTNDLTITLSEACYNYKRLLVIGQTYHSTYVTATIINPQRNKLFTLNDNFAYHNLSLTTPEPFTLYMRQVPWTISSNGLQIQQTGTYGQRYLRESTQTAGWNNNFNIKIIKVIAFKN